MHVALSCFGDHSIGLVAELIRNLAVRRHHLGRRQDLLVIACIVRRDLDSFGATVPAPGQRILDLLSARTGGFKILSRESFDFGGAAPSGLDLIAQIAKLVGKVRLINRRRISLGIEQSPWLESAGAAVLALRDVEYDTVGVKRGAA